MHIFISFYLKIIIKQVRLDTLVAHLSLRTGQVRFTPGEGEHAGHIQRLKTVPEKKGAIL